MKGDENGQFANIKTEHFLNVWWEICEAHIVDILIEKVAHLVNPGITDEDIGDFAGSANQEVGRKNIDIGIGCKIRRGITTLCLIL